MSKHSGCKKVLSLAAILGLTVLGAAAQAGFTSINPPNYGKGGEASQAEILSNAYGETFSSSGVNFTSSSFTATRLDDTTDQTFSFDIKSSKALATFAAYKQAFGYNSTELFTVTGSGYAVTGSTGAVDLPASYSFTRGGTGFLQSSTEASNQDGKDHLVTYLLTGSGITDTTYVLFWEDKTTGQKSDFDFNDLVVEVKAGSPVVVPLPAAAWSGLATLAGGAILTGYRKARKLMA